MSQNRTPSDFYLIGNFPLEGAEAVVSNRATGGNTKHYVYDTLVALDHPDACTATVYQSDKDQYHWVPGRFRHFAGRDEPFENHTVVQAIVRAHYIVDANGMRTFDLDAIVFSNAGIGTPSSNDCYADSIPNFGAVKYIVTGTTTGPVVPAGNGQGREVPVAASSFVFNENVPSNMIASFMGPRWRNLWQSPANTPVSIQGILIHSTEENPTSLRGFVQNISYGSPLHGAPATTSTPSVPVTPSVNKTATQTWGPSPSSLKRARVFSDNGTPSTPVRSAASSSKQALPLSNSLNLSSVDITPAPHKPHSVQTLPPSPLRLSPTASIKSVNINARAAAALDALNAPAGVLLPTVPSFADVRDDIPPKKAPSKPRVRKTPVKKQPPRGTNKGKGRATVADYEDEEAVSGEMNLDAGGSGSVA